MKNKLGIKNYLYEFLFVLLPMYGIITFYNKTPNKYCDILAIFVFFVFQYLFNQYKKSKLDKVMLSLSILYSLMYVFGTIIDKNFDPYYNLFKNNMGINCLYLYSITIFIYFILLKIKDTFKSLKKTDEINVLNKKKVALLFILILASYIPYYIAFFPGLLSPDSMAQVSQALGDSSLSNHHPVAHTLFLSIFLNIGKSLSDVTLGVAIYSFVQMLIMTSIFVYTLIFISNYKQNKLLFLLSIAFYIIVPVFGFYSVTMWKDVLFGCFALLLMISVYKYATLGLTDKKNNIFLVISVILTSLFRSNGIYVTIALALIILLFLKEKRKLTLYFLVIPSILCAIIVGPIYSMCGIKKGNLVESLSIPLEQVSSVAVNKLPMDKDTTKFLNRLVGIDTIRNKYSLVSIDGVKFDPNFDNEYLEKHKAEFFAIWFKLLMKYPSTYVQTYLKSTYGFWYVESKGYSVHVWTIDSNSYKLKTNDNFLTPKLVDYHERFYYYPILKYFMEPAFMLVTAMFAFASALVVDKKKHIYPLLVPLLVWGTIMIATPVSYQTRYVFGLFTTFPFVVFVLYDIYRNSSKRKVGSK